MFFLAWHVLALFAFVFLIGILCAQLWFFGDRFHDDDFDDWGCV